MPNRAMESFAEVDDRDPRTIGKQLKKQKTLQYYSSARNSFFEARSTQWGKRTRRKKRANIQNLRFGLSCV